MDEKGNLVADSTIFWLGGRIVTQTEIHTTEPLMPGPSAFEV
jgi:hypothetical protein